MTNEVQAIVLAWARGRSIVDMMKTLPCIYVGTLPDLECLTSETVAVTDVRKVYL